MYLNCSKTYTHNQNKLFVKTTDERYKHETSNIKHLTGKTILMFPRHQLITSSHIECQGTDQIRREKNLNTIAFLTAFSDQCNFCSGVDFIFIVRNFSRKLLSINLPTCILVFMSPILVYMRVMQLNYFQILKKLNLT